MEQYEHLPIYKKAYELALYFENIVRNFSRYHVNIPWGRSCGRNPGEYYS